MRARLLLLGTVLLALLVAVIWRWPHRQSPGPSAHRLTAPTRGSPPPPNVLLISIDDTRPDHLGCYGYRQRPTTPNLDRFAAQCVRFSNAHSQAPITFMSHMSLMTSATPADTGVLSLNAVLPAQVPTLAQLLQKAGYNTAALVNNGQMLPHWGFNRGFNLWREFETFTPEGNCQHVSDAALGWLGAQPRQPFFLFLHYYDSHLPYTAPADLLDRFGVTLPQAEVSGAVSGHRYPDQPMPEPLRQQLLATYDACIAWQDRQIIRVLDALPPNTLVVLFSDHGEAFKEHGWTFHGAALYEEETHVLLMMRPPSAAGRPAAGAVVDNPVMLMDVAPTILGYCQVHIPAHFAGADLRARIDGQPLAPRLIPSETREMRVGQIATGVRAGNLEAIYSLLDSRLELYRLPDEHTDLAANPPPDGQALISVLRRWVATNNQDDFWVIHAQGEHDVDIRLDIPKGQLEYVEPAGQNMEKGGSLEVQPDGRAARWKVRATQRGAVLVFHTSEVDDPVRIDAKVDGQPVQRIFLDQEQTNSVALPAVLQLADKAASPWVEHPFHPKGDGIYVIRRRNPTAATRPEQREPLDEKTIRQLKALGYLQ